MTKKEAEDYRYGYQHIGVVNYKNVSIRKLSNCGGWLDLDTGEFYTNTSVEEIKKVNSKPISQGAKPLKIN